MEGDNDSFARILVVIDPVGTGLVIENETVLNELLDQFVGGERRGLRHISA